MKRFSIAASAILLTSGLAFFAIAVAHRDSRNQMDFGIESRPEYADQAVAPIEIQFPSKNELRASLHEIGSLRSTSTPAQESVDESESDSFESVAEPPRISNSEQFVNNPLPAEMHVDSEQQISGESDQLEPTPFASIQTIQNVSSQDNYVKGHIDGPIDASNEPSEVQLAGSFEGSIRPLPPAKLLPPPSVVTPPVVTPGPIGDSTAGAAPVANAAPALMPPSSFPSAPTATENRVVASPGFAVPSNVAPKLGPPTSVVPGATPFGNASGNDPAALTGSERVESPSGFAAGVPNPASEAPSLTRGNSLNGTASATPSPFAKPTSSWPNSTIQTAQPLATERASAPQVPSSFQSATSQSAASQRASSQMMSPQPMQSQPINNRPLNSSMTFKAEPAQATEALLASSAPGVRQLDGSQNPSLQIHKRAPEEVQVDHPATFTLLIRNVGTATAYDVVITDSVPRGTRLSKTNPPAQSRNDGALVWSLGEMSAGSEQVLTVEVIPETEGEIGSVASVTFAAQASVRTVSTQPKLVVNQSTSGKVLLGQPVKIQISITNEGTGVARGVSLEEDVPPGLRHPMGATLGVPLGDLVPGQSRTTQLELIGVEPGVVQNLLRAVSSNASTAESSVPIEVVAPQLRLTAGGPKLRYLERPATYQVSITNSGTSMAHNVEIFAYLPRGMQFNSAINDGEYLSDQHAVTWGLEELAVGATATTEMTLLPVEEGDYVIRMQGRGDGVKSEPFEKPLRIEGQSELAFSIEDDNDPIETDEQTTYVVKLTNNGTRIDQDVSLLIELPPGAKVLQVNAPVAYNVTREGIVFDPIPQVKAKDQQSFRFSLQLTQEGTQVVRAQVKSKLRPLAIVKEESTQVYHDH
ncbi:MAG: hypothetical protein NTW52_11535 [Planctomycetota bacterium]|nr:hypothetical protein [Planctomycetota bacterium]